jgi:hypothetical protein
MTNTAVDTIAPYAAACLRATLSHLRSTYGLDLASIAALAGANFELVAAVDAGLEPPPAALQRQIEALRRRMAFASREAWLQRVEVSRGYDMLLDQDLKIVAVTQQKTSGGLRIPWGLFLGRTFNELLPTLDCRLIETHGNGIDDLKTNGFFAGRIACVRFCAEINSGPVVHSGVLEFHPVETIDAGILVHHVMHRRDDIPRLLTSPGIYVHWRETVTKPE